MSSTDAEKRVEENNKKVSENFKKWRTSHQPRYTQTDIGKIIGRKPQTVQKMENGTTNITAGALLEIANACNVPIDVFLGPILEKVPQRLTVEQVEILLQACKDILTLQSDNTPPEETQDAA